MFHAMTYVGDALEGRCISCGGEWVKNTDVNPYNRMPNWRTDAGEYQSPNCSGKKEEHNKDCNCRGCRLEKKI
jgi:hypothetical protein